MSHRGAHLVLLSVTHSLRSDDDAIETEPLRQRSVGPYPLLFASHAAKAASLAATASRQPGSAARPSYQRPTSAKRARGSPKRAALGTKAPMEKSAMVSRSPVSHGLPFR